MCRKPEISRKSKLSDAATEKGAATVRPTAVANDDPRGIFSAISCEETSGEVILGRLAVSKAGHDKDGAFVIIGTVDEEHLLLADGRLRTLEKPKKKKVRHLSVKNAFSKELHDKLASGARIENAELRKFIASACECAAEEK